MYSTAPMIIHDSDSNETDSSTAYSGWQDDEIRETATIDEYLAAIYLRDSNQAYRVTTYGEQDVSENISPPYYGALYEYLSVDVRQILGFDNYSKEMLACSLGGLYRRADDGITYTREEFQAKYGNFEKWN